MTVPYWSTRPSEILTSKSRARVEMPRNIDIEIRAMIPSVAAAFRLFGSRKACTPSATASIPVRAVDPEAKALSIRNNVTPPSSGSRSIPAEGA
jgi:hypothetical protein